MSRYGDIADAIRESVRADIRSGPTIEAIMARYDVPKRFVEDQRTAMLESEQIPDARCSTGSGDTIRRMHRRVQRARSPRNFR